MNPYASSWMTDLKLQADSAQAMDKSECGLNPMYIQFVTTVPASVGNWLLQTGQLGDFKQGALLRWDTDANGQVKDAQLFPDQRHGKEHENDPA